MTHTESRDLIVRQLQSDAIAAAGLQQQDSASIGEQPAQSGRSPVAGLKKLVESHFLAAKRHYGAAAVHACAAGVALNRAREEVAPKEWLKFLRSNFGSGKSPVSVRTCQRYMRLARCWPQIAERLRATVDATRVSSSQVEEILQGISLRTALRLIGDQHHISVEGGDQSDAIADHEHANSGSLKSCQTANNWLTPPAVLRAIERLWGHIDIDPCAEDSEVPHVAAQRRYRLSDDGLAPINPWFGNVYVNPGQVGDLRPWIERVMAEFASGNIREALLLLPAVTDALWADLVQPYPHAFLHARPSVTLVHEREMQVPLSQPAMLIFLGAAGRLNDFAEQFGVLADVFQPYLFPQFAG